MSESTSRFPIEELPPSNQPPNKVGPQLQRTEPAAPASFDRTVIAQSPIAGPAEFYPVGTVASLARVLIGQTLDQFQLHELIGGGGMGAVFRASDLRLDRQVAVKVIPNIGRDADTLRRFQIEAQSAAKLDHPHIARVYYVGETEAWSYIVFEYVEGVNLRDLVIRQGPLPIDDAVCYAVQVAEALQHASERSVVHRDIKPSNVLVTPQGFVKVVDMGLARMTSLDAPAKDLTASGVTLGTFDYISPEQARDPRSADIRSDLYSLGCTIYYTLTGRPPFGEGNALQKLFMHGSAEATPVIDFRDDVPPDLDAIIRRLMAKRPQDRYQSAADLAADLRMLADLEGLEKSQQMSGLISISNLPVQNFWELATPWLVGVLVILGSTWYLISQQRYLGAYAIPREIEGEFHEFTSFVAPESSIASASNSQALRDGDLAPLKPIEPPTAVVEGMLNAKPSEPMKSKAEEPDKLNDDSLADDLPFRVLWVHPFDDPASKVAAENNSEYRSFVGSLSSAMAFAERQTSIEEIWLDDDVWVIDRAWTMLRKSLIVRSAPNRRARLEWRLSRSPDFAQEEARGEWMYGLELNQQQLIFDDLEIAVFPPDSGFGRYDFARLHAGAAIRFLRSSLTLHPSSGGWKMAAFGASSRAAERTSSPSMKGLLASEPLQISLEDTVIRGEGDLLSLPSTKRTELTWRNGLLAISGRVIEAGGASEVSRTPPTIRCDLQNVTLASQSGFARIRLSDEAANPICLSRISNNCAYWNSGEFPMVALDGLPSEASEIPVDELSAWLDFRGADNAYDQELSELVRVRTAGGKTFSFDFQGSVDRFFADRVPETTVFWLNRIPVSTDFAAHSAGDYLQRAGSFLPGFRVEFLPNH
jgi:serine/threonine protein kinase